MTLPDNDMVHGNLVKILMDNLDKLHDDIRNLLFKLVDKNRPVAESLAEALLDNYCFVERHVKALVG